MHMTVTTALVRIAGLWGVSSLDLDCVVFAGTLQACEKFNAALLDYMSQGMSARAAVSFIYSVWE
jgi:hypothetical protein